MIHINLNGEARAVAAITIAGLLDELGLPPAKVAVERNREIVARSTFGTALIAPGDELEIVHFVGGG